MRTWYLFRNGAQSGPYSAQELLNMMAQGALFPQDIFIENGRRYPINKAQKKWRKNAGFRPKKRHTGLIVFLVIVLLIGGFIGYKYLTKKSDNMTLGAETQVISETVSPDGGHVTVTSGILDGFDIDIPSGAYMQATDFDISTRPIENHKFGALFNPVTPLISIENGDVFADEGIAVTIPIEKSDDEFAMGFYYDEKTGALEGIPLISLDNDRITLFTSHFCEIVVSKVKLTDLADVEVVTGFTPGVDDWQFRNFGSLIAPKGHCAGQSVSAMWYYNQMVLNEGAPRLYGLYDNYNYGISTSKFWRDDSEAYRFASVIQKAINWDTRLRKDRKELSKAHPIWSMNAFIYAMQMTGEPQYVEIWGQKTKSDGTVQISGHAMVAYAIIGNTIYIADPNYPGATNRSITFDGTKFNTYSSGQNAAAIEAGNDFPYTGIYYIGQSALINNSAIKAEFDKMLDKTIGDDQFPTCVYQYLKSKDDEGKTTWVDLPATLELNSADIMKELGEPYKDKIRICVETPYHNLDVYLYVGLTDTGYKQQTKTDEHGLAYFTIELEPGINDIGVYVCNLVNITATRKSDKFIEFQRFKVVYDQAVDMWFDKDPYGVVVGGESAFSVTAKDAPEDVTYVWDFGTGDALETSEPKVKYTYDKPGDFVISCTLKNNADGKVLGEAQAQVDALDLYGNWDFAYRINESEAVDSIINFIIDLFVKFFQSLFPDADLNDDYSFTLEGTVVYGTLYVMQSADDVSEQYEDIVVNIQLRQEYASNDLVEVSDEPIDGYMVIDGNKVEIHITGEDDSGELISAMVFKGELTNQFISGTYTASGLLSGTFSASK